MQQKNKNQKQESKKPGAESNVKNAGENVRAAHDEAEADIEKDPDFSMRGPNDDLDEGETARLGEDKTDLV